MRTQIKTRKFPQARENTSNKVAFDFSFESNWLKKWRQFYSPITGQNIAKLMQSWITHFNTKLLYQNQQRNTVFCHVTNTDLSPGMTTGRIDTTGLRWLSSFLNTPAENIRK